VLKLLGHWLRAGVMEEGQLRTATAGTPQGGVITPPTMLQNASIECVGASHKRVRRHAEHDVDLGMVDLHTADQHANDSTAGEPIGSLETAFDLSGEVF